MRHCLVVFAALAVTHLVVHAIPQDNEVQGTIDFATIGQQKCGTSSLWNYLSQSPFVRTAGKYKESFQFQRDLPNQARCDSSLERYLERSAEARAAAVAEGLPASAVRVGDWSATHLSCACCPMLFRTLNPNMRFVVMLRDPVQRSVSRFLEQQQLQRGPQHGEVKDTTFASYIVAEMNRTQYCVDNAERFRRSQRRVAAARPSPPADTAATAAETREARIGAASSSESNREVLLQAGLRKDASAVGTSGADVDPARLAQASTPVTADMNIQWHHRSNRLRRQRSRRRALQATSSIGSRGPDKHLGELGTGPRQGPLLATTGLAHGDARRLHGDANTPGSSSSSSSSSDTINGTEQFLGWGPDMPLSEMMRRQCYQRSSILGWSVYEVFLENYFAFFPPQQLLVQYTEDLEAQPLAVLRRVEEHIGVPRHDFNETQIATVYNARGCYKWRCGKTQSDVPSMQGTALAASEAEFEAAVRQLVAFLRPHVHRLFRWADEGRIASVPQAWRHMYA